MLRTVWPLYLGLRSPLSPLTSDASAFASLLTVKTETRVAEVSLSEELPLNLTGNGTSGNASVDERLEDILVQNLKHGMEDLNNMGDMENTTDPVRHGLGHLGTNLEFLMLKVAQLETAVELQQAPIKKQEEEIRNLQTPAPSC